MTHVLRMAVVWSVAISTTAMAADRITVRGEPTKRWIEGDDLGFYYEIPTDNDLEIEVVGPGTLIMFLVNHEAPGTRGNSLLVVTRGKRPWKRLKLGCAPTSKRFIDETDIEPCKRKTRDLQISAGLQRLGLRLKRTKLGASVHFLFASQAQLNLEPALATATGGADELSWEEMEGLEPLPAVDPEIGGVTAREPATGLDAAVRNPWTWALAGVALAAGGTGIVFGLMSSDNFADAEPVSTSQEKWEGLNDDGQRNAVIANVLFGTAGVSLAAATLLFVLDARGAPAAAGTPAAASEAHTWLVAPRVAADAWGVDACVRF